jgi:cell division protease FtsH
MADNDDFFDDVAEINAMDMVPVGGTRSVTSTLPQMMIRLALTPEHTNMLRRDRTTCMVIQAPSADWVEPLTRAAKILGEWKFVHSARQPDKSKVGPDVTATQAIYALSNGGRTLGVSQNPAACLSKALTGSADIYLKIENPDDELLREAIKTATGGYPRSFPAGISAGLDYIDICSSIRVGSTAKACVERLQAAGKSGTTMVDTSLADVPDLHQLEGYGAAKEWGEALLTDLAAWRAGKLDFASISRTLVMASEPGLGKTTFARSLAKTAGLPFFATSVSKWFADGPGYLDSVIKQIDQLFDAASQVAPAIILIDELEGIPSRANLKDRGDWWIPVVGHMLLKLDSAVSSISSKLIIIGATNHPEKLDAALVRPGRLSNIIYIGKPDAAALEAILRQHLAGDLAGVDLRLVATLGHGSTGADATGWVKSARRVARQQGRDMILQDLMQQVAPPETRPPKYVQRVAVHEAAHAVISHLVMPGSVAAVSIVGRPGVEGGHTAMRLNFSGTASRQDLENTVLISLAGRCGEQVIMGSVTGGAGGSDDSDLGQSTHLLAAMHTSLGLGDRLLYRVDPKEVRQLLAVDPNLANTVEADLQRLYAAGIKMVEQHADLVRTVAAALLKHRHLSGEQFLAVCLKAIAKPAVKAPGGGNG